MKRLQKLIVLRFIFLGGTIFGSYPLDKKFSGEEYKDPEEVVRENDLFDYYTAKILYAESQVMNNDPQAKAQQDAELARQKGALPWGLQWLALLFKNNYQVKDVLSVDDKDIADIVAANISKQVAAQEFYKANFKNDGEKQNFFNEPFVLEKMNQAGVKYKNSEKYHRSRYYGISSQEAVNVADKYITDEEVQVQIKRARDLNSCGYTNGPLKGNIVDECIKQRNCRLPREESRIIFEAQLVADLKENNPIDKNPATNKYAQLFDRIA